jgi:hypothetical protein
MEPVPTRTADVPAARRRPAHHSATAPDRDAGSQPLYRHRGVLVTYDVLVVGERRHAIAGLSRLRTARCTRNPVIAWMAVLVGAVLAAVGVGITLGLHPSGPSRETYLVLAVAVTLPASVVLYGGHRARRSHELWADHQGQAVRLFAGTDAREFGQVCRAVMRAREAAAPNAGH